MGMRFRKSINLGGGTKLNLSKSGVGLSTGVKGFRKSVNTSGRSRTTASIPGTGLSFVKESGGSSRKSGSYRSTGHAAGSRSASSPGPVKEKPPLLDRPGFIILLLILFAPVGILLMWKKFPQWSKGLKIALSVIFGLFWIYAIFGTAGDKKDPVPDEPSRAVTEVEKRDDAETQAKETPSDELTTLPLIEEPQEVETETTTAPQKADTPAAETQQSAPPAAETQQPETPSRSTQTEESSGTSWSSGSESSSPENTQPDYSYCGSKNSDKFHYAWCPAAQNIKSSNMIHFSSRDDAISRGKVPCKDCNP